MSGVLVALSLLVTYRLSRLVTGDYITERPRHWLQKHLPEKLAYLIGCPWCASPYIGAGVGWVATEWPTSRVVWVIWLALAGSAVAGQLASLEAVEDLGTLDDGGEPEPDADAE